MPVRLLRLRRQVRRQRILSRRRCFRLLPPPGLPGRRTPQRLLTRLRCSIRRLRFRSRPRLRLPSPPLRL